MPVSKVLGWGECSAKNGTTVYNDIVANSASLSVEEGEEREALIEGNIAEARMQLPDKYIIEFDRRLAAGESVTPGFTENAGSIAVVPKAVGAVFCQLTGCSRKITLKQDSTDGLVAHYLYKTKGSTDSNGDLDDVTISTNNAATVEYSAVSTSITGYSSKNPMTEGWFVKNGDVYIHALDTTPVEGTTYYELTAAS